MCFGTSRDFHGHSGFLDRCGWPAADSGGGDEGEDFLEGAAGDLVAFSAVDGEDAQVPVAA